MIHEKQIEVRYAETGIAGKLKPVSIFNYLQDVASEHCAVLGISAWDMLLKGLAWVVLNYQLVIYKYPVWKEDLVIRTWRYPHRKLYELRQYKIFDQHQHLLIDAKSSWVLTNLSTKKPVRLDRHLPENIMADRQLKIENDLIALDQSARPEATRIFQTRMHDLDFNRHVNNSVYAVWALESIPSHIISTHDPEKIIINYIGESLYGDRIRSNTQHLASKPSNIFLHSLINEQTQKEITRVKTEWKKNNLDARHDGRDIHP